MASDVTMPRLSDSMEEGTVLKWLVDQGSEVKRGEPLVEIETDKANMTYDADTDGTLIEIVAQEGDTLAIGEVIARIGDPSEASGNGKPSGGTEAPAQEEADGGGEEAGKEAGEEQAEGAEAEAGAAAEGKAEGDGAAAEGDEEPAAARGEAGGGGGGGETGAGDGGGTATRTRAPTGNGAGDGGRVKA